MAGQIRGFFPFGFAQGQNDNFKERRRATTRSADGALLDV